MHINDIDAGAISPVGTDAMRGAIIGGTMLNKYLEEELKHYLQNHQYLLRDRITPTVASRVLSWGRDATKAKIAIGKMMPESSASWTCILSTMAPIFKANSSNDEDGLRADKDKCLVFDL